MKTLAFGVLTTSALGIAGFTGGCASTASNDEACDRYFNAAYSGRCYSTTVSSERRGQMRTRFRSVCAKQLAAPGTSITVGYLEACGNALNALPCGVIENPTECKFPVGTLADGSPCRNDFQCKSSYCNRGGTQKADGGLTPLQACGVCAAAIAEGGACASSDWCGIDASCWDGKCTKTLVHDVGGECASTTVPIRCKNGLSCDSGTHKCLAPAAEGEGCVSIYDCQQPNLGCVANHCKTRVGEGTACRLDVECEVQLGCNPATKTCGKRPTAKAGEPCDSFTVCDTGICNIVSAELGTGVCPTLIPDGASCSYETRMAVCDEFALCEDGTCKVDDPAACK